MARLWWLSQNAINFRMNNAFFKDFQAVSLVGGGEIGADDLELALSHAPGIVAADSGADAVLAAGHMPDAVIGDFDSASASALAQIPPERLFRISEQDSTDFEKALSRLEAGLILGVGFLGLRVDHQLAAFNALVRFKDKPCILIGRDELVFHLNRTVRLDLEPGDTVSLFPFQPISGTSNGLHWPINELDLSPTGRIGTSNRATGPFEISVSGEGMLVLVPRARLAPVIRGVLAMHGAAS